MTDLRKQQELFCLEYIRLRKKNATQAAINAGYSPKSAQSQASQLLMKPKVKEFIKQQELLMAEGLRQEFAMDALEARDVMYKIMISPDADDADKIRCAKDFLDRAGFKAIEKVDMKVNDSREAVNLERYIDAWEKEENITKG